MKLGLNKLFILLLTFILVSSLVSAGFWDSITGKVTDETCTDSDGPKNFNEKGKAYGTIGSSDPKTIRIPQWHEDYCITEIFVYDYTCKSNVDPEYTGIGLWVDAYECPNGCQDGACIGAGPIQPSRILTVQPTANNAPVANDVTPPPQECNGCLKDSTCLSFGTRVEDNVPKYCYINGNIIEQKDDGAVCQNNYECKANQCSNDKCGAPEVTSPPQECNGCLKDSTCLSFGTRRIEDDTPKYCDITKEFITQKEKEELCQNNYECMTNQCDDGVCGSLREELEETRNLLQGIIDWVKRVFGIEIGG